MILSFAVDNLFFTRKGLEIERRFRHKNGGFDKGVQKLLGTKESIGP